MKRQQKLQKKFRSLKNLFVPPNQAPSSDNSSHSLENLANSSSSDAEQPLITWGETLSEELIQQHPKEAEPPTKGNMKPASKAKKTKKASAEVELNFSLANQFNGYLHLANAVSGADQLEQVNIYLDFQKHLFVLHLPNLAAEFLSSEFNYAHHLSGDLNMAGWYRVISFEDVILYSLDQHIITLYVCKYLQPLKITTTANDNLVVTLENSPPAYFMQLSASAILPSPQRNIASLEMILGIKLPRFFINLSEQHLSDRALSTRLASFRFHDEYAKWIHFIRSAVKLPLSGGVPDDEAIRRYVSYLVTSNQAIRREDPDTSLLGRAFKSVTNFFKKF